MENIPEYIFDWIETLPFDKLSPAQQEEVMQYMSREEYIQLNTAALAAHAHFAAGADVQGDEHNTLTALHKKFDAHYVPPQKQRPKLIIWWQAAAAVLLIAVAWLGVKYTTLSGMQNNSGASFKDTVYITVTKEVPREVTIHDTVVITREAVRRNEIPRPPVVNAPVKTVLPPVSLKTVPLSEKDAPENSSKNSSIKGDSLISNFTFVRS